jgi:ribose transport system substrate-binding protein
VDAKCGLTVNTDQVKFGKQLAQFIVDELKGQGNVVMVTGVAGTGADNDRNKGAKEVFAANPGIKLVAEYSGMWDSATAQRNTSAQLPSLPKVDGVWVSGGTDGVIKAFAEAGKPMPVVGGEGENGFRKYMAGISTPKVNGMSIGQPPFLSVIALELARAVLKGEHPKTSIEIPFPVATSDSLKSGETVFPDLPDSFFADFTDSGPNATVVLCQEAATDGTPCPGSLKVNLGSS